MELAPLKLCSLLLLAVGCPAGLEPPEARIRGGSSQTAERDRVCDEELGTLTVRVAEPAALHGACSHDPNGLDLSYEWAVVDQPNGSLLEIPNETVISPSVVPDVPGHYRLSLIVSNGTLTSKRAYVTLDAE